MRRILIGLLLILALPSAASARGRTVAPPGNSGVSQYVESIPTVKGNRPTSTITPGGGGGGANGGSTAGALTASTQRTLDRQGSGGRQVAELAEATGPGRARHYRSRSGAGVSSVSKLTPEPSTASVSSPASAVLKAFTGVTTHGGLGALLPAILILGAVGPGLLVLRRRRTNN